MSKPSMEVWIVINNGTDRLLFYGTRSEADKYKNKMQPLINDTLRVRLLKRGMAIFEQH